MLTSNLSLGGPWLFPSLWKCEEVKTTSSENSHAFGWRWRSLDYVVHVDTELPASHPSEAQGKAQKISSLAQERSRTELSSLFRYLQFLVFPSWSWIICELFKEQQPHRHPIHQPPARPAALAPGWFTAISSLQRHESHSCSDHCGLCGVYLLILWFVLGAIFSPWTLRNALWDPFTTPDCGTSPSNEARLSGMHVYTEAAAWHLGIIYSQRSSSLQRCGETWKQQAFIQPCCGNPSMQTSWETPFSSFRIDPALSSPPSRIPCPTFHSKCQNAWNLHERLFPLCWLLRWYLEI